LRIWSPGEKNCLGTGNRGEQVCLRIRNRGEKNCLGTGNRGEEACLGIGSRGEHACLGTRNRGDQACLEIGSRGEQACLETELSTRNNVVCRYPGISTSHTVESHLFITRVISASHTKNRTQNQQMFKTISHVGYAVNLIRQC
jgi:hypothetical protein